jgi:biotin carboxyl carrier protein
VLAAFVLFHHISATNRYKTVWEELGRWRMHPQFEVQIGESVVSVYYRISENILWVEGREFKFQARFERRSPHQYSISIEDRREVVFVALKNDEGTLIHSGGQVTMVKSTQLEQHHPVFLHGSEMSEQQQGDIVVSPLHGRIVRIAIEQQQVVALHDLLLVIESMKSENQILAHKKGKIKKILGKIGDQVTDGMPLIIIEDQ